MPRFAALCLVAIALVALELSQSSLPVDAQTIPNFQSIELTQDSASRALDAMPAVYEVAQRYEDRVPRDRSGDPLSGMANMALYQLAKSDLDGAVGPHGFSDYEDWVVHVSSLFHAYSFVQSSGAMAAAAPAMQQAMEKLRNDPNIPEAQKRALLAQMGQMNTAQSAMAAGAPSQNNQEIARLLSDRIMEVTETMRSRP